ncbi:hypothetical protein B0I35DRAFT_472630 [Stachybotrys elegans]|uniref:Uncharacterized protein n=1 Tax=Stachybotrys elegans TaxID=80388 RepID=A0A8K0T4F4_9HYPO|nr:hypothetical protein B0I35DRAFT_472630 [Stachybotrys elegans]
MALVEYSSQLERDLRSADREFKRHRDLVAKWANGARPLDSPGHVEVQYLGIEKRGKAFPRLLRPQKNSHPRKSHHNMVKTLRGHNHELPPGRVRRAAHIQAEMDQSFLENPPIECPSLASAEQMVTENTGRQCQATTDLLLPPLSLDHFIKTTGRETEQFVEKEYGIIDANGQLLEGRKARQNLRHGKDQSIQAVEGYEVI